jgi:hypothetical protein
MRYRAPSALPAIAALALLAAGCGGASEAEYRVPSLPVEQLKPCKRGLPKPDGFRCGSIEVPFEREDDSLGRTTVGFAVRPRDDGMSLHAGRSSRPRAGRGSRAAEA